MRNFLSPLTAILFSGLLLFAAGCAETPTDPGSELTLDEQFSPADTMQEMETEQDSTSDLTVAEVGGTFTISLESNPTTGYSWQAEFDSESLELVSEDFASDSTLIGAGGIQTFEFLALKEGQIEVTMVYKRPWENESIDTKVFPVKVTPAGEAQEAIPDALDQMVAEVGKAFTIPLESNPITGYSWQAEFDPESLELVSEDFTSDSALIGAGGIQTFEFMALKQGQVLVTMVYKRPWEDGSIDTKVSPVNIIAAGE